MTLSGIHYCTVDLLVILYFLLQSLPFHSCNKVKNQCNIRTPGDVNAGQNFHLL